MSELAEAPTAAMAGRSQASPPGSDFTSTRNRGAGSTVHYSDSLPFTLGSDRADSSTTIPSVDAAHNTTTEHYAKALRLLDTNNQEADPNQALCLLEAAASREHVESAVLLGQVLVSLEGEQQRAARWLQWAAERGSGLACHLLGLLRFHGAGGAIDLRAARQLQAQAALQGLPAAQFELSLLLAQGLGGPVDERGAQQWEDKAATAGHPRACLNRAVRCATSAPPDWNGAVSWYERAVAAGSAEAAARLCKMYLQGEGVARSQRAARRWFVLAAELGFDFSADGQ